MRYTACDKCLGPVRVDDGSYLNHKGEQCVHFFTIGVDTGRNAESVTVVFRGPNGKVSIPWEHNTPCPPGYVREEVRGARAVRRLEKELDAKDVARYRRHQQKLQTIFAPQRARRREDLKQIIREGVTTHEGRTIRVSQFGRDLARERLRRLDQEGTRGNYDPGNYRRE